MFVDDVVLREDVKCLIQALFTDLDGVIRHWSVEQIARAETLAGLPKGSFWKVVFEPELLQLVVTGRMSHDEWQAESERRLQRLHPEADVQQAVRLWSEARAQVDTEVLELVRRCRRQVPVGLITNATSRLRSDLEELQLIDEFDHIFNTSELGVAKPDESVFRIALQTVGVQPEHSFFIDDRAENVRTAEELGMRAHLYEDVESLRRALRAEGII